MEKHFYVGHILFAEGLGVQKLFSSVPILAKLLWILGTGSHTGKNLVTFSTVNAKNISKLTY